MNLTVSQNDAVTADGKTLLVSAGAGSGKTTVLTQRIIRRILDGVDIERLLVVTFTKSAAADLKEKLYSSLLEELASDNGNKKLASTLLKVPSANISTIHSFCFNLIKENFNILSISPKVRVADSSERDILLSICIDECIESLLKNENHDLIGLADNFSGYKNMNSFTDMIKYIYSRLISVPFWRDSYEKAVNMNMDQYQKAESAGFFSCKPGVLIKNETDYRIGRLARQAERLFDYICTCADSEKNIEPVEAMYCQLKNINEITKETYDEYRAALDTFSPPRLNTKGMPEDVSEYIKSEKKEITENIKKLKNRFYRDTEEKILSDYKKTIDLNRMLKDFLCLLDDRFSRAKAERVVVDFSDLEQMTLELLSEKLPDGYTRSGLCIEIRNRFDELYIDEYQDINPLQDIIFRLLSKENNRFMVGDSKQSIYRFRNASPEIFLGYLDEYEAYPNETQNAKIFLRENFRSSKPLIDFINMVFDKLYTPVNTGADYSEERLVFSGGNNALAPVDIMLFTDNDEDGESKRELEAEFICRKIKLLMKRHIKQNGEKLRYGDIVLLFRSIKNATFEYEAAFRRHGIPFSLEKNSSFLLEPEVLLALSILRVIDNPTDDISLAAVLRSPLFRLTAGELYEIKNYYGFDVLYDNITACAYEYKRILEKGKKYYVFPGMKAVLYRGRGPRRIRGCSSGPKPLMETMEKTFYFRNILNILRNTAAESSSCRLIWTMYQKTDIISIAAAEESGENRKRNLYLLYNFALQFEKTSFKGLGTFLDYIDDIVKNGISMDMGTEEDGSKVRFMTVHKSKGLEFPVCFVCDMGKKFNFEDLKKKYIYTDECFNYFTVRENDGLTEYEPLVKKAALLMEADKMKSEELRCLYVALTRAREVLVLSGGIKGSAAEKELDYKNAGSQLEWILAAADGEHSNFFNISVYDGDFENVSHDYNEHDIDDIPLPQYKGALESIDYEYPYTETTGLSAKLAVSEIKKGIFEDDEYIRVISAGDVIARPVFETGGVKSGRDKGNALHNFMQFCDFVHIEADGVKQEAKRLYEKRLITAEHFNLLDYSRLEVFFKSKIYSEIKNSPAVFREKRFTIIEDSGLLKKCTNEKLLVQGVIDCFYLDPSGTYTVLDYKTDSLPAEGGDIILADRHRTQVVYYCRAVEKMTGNKVGRAVLYSFSLGREVEIFDETKKEKAIAAD